MRVWDYTTMDGKITGFIIALLLLNCSSIFCQSIIPDQYMLEVEESLSKESTGLKTNIVTEIVLSGEKSVWLGTNAGLAVIRNNEQVIFFDTLSIGGSIDSIFTDGISAIGATGVQLAFAGSYTRNGFSAGSGLYLSDNALDDVPVWRFLDQPTDAVGDSLGFFSQGYFKTIPVTTDIANVTYDIAYSKHYVWIVSWAGGLRRLHLESDNAVWERIPLPLDNDTSLNTCSDDIYAEEDGINIISDYMLNPRDPSDGGNHNHKGFSVLAYGDTIWVGTANGINRGIIEEKGCINWQHYYFPVDGITGNFVVGLARQIWMGEQIIWAVTVNADTEEERGLSYTTNDGDTWQSVPDLTNVRVYNVEAQDSIILVSSEDGLWTSTDRINWSLADPPAENDVVSSREILSTTVYSAVVDTRIGENDPTIWIGTPDGVAHLSNLFSDDWNVIQAEYDPNEVYAYPNPYSPYVHNQLNDDGWVRFHIKGEPPPILKMQIYDFSLREVFSKTFNFAEISGAIKWNGRDSNGRIVANGIYFVQLKWSSYEEWIKLAVVK